MQSRGGVNPTELVREMDAMCIFQLQIFIVIARWGTTDQV